MKAVIEFIAVLVFVLDIFYITNRLAELNIASEKDSTLLDLFCVFSLGIAFLLLLIF